MRSRWITVALSALALMTLALPAQAHGGDESGTYGGEGSWDGSYSGGDRAPRRARSYINPDTGAATVNRDVDPNSNCANPDRYDNQKLSAAGSTANNVHNDACLFRGWQTGRVSDVDGPASYYSTGAGYISACPDPDGAGPKVAFTRDNNGDGRADSCHQTGYQQRGTAGDLEFHARLNNDSAPGEQRVVWCYDPGFDGCADTSVKDTVRVNWQR